MSLQGSARPQGWIGAPWCELGSHGAQPSPICGDRPAFPVQPCSTPAPSPFMEKLREKNTSINKGMGPQGMQVLWPLSPPAPAVKSSGVPRLLFPRQPRETAAGAGECRGREPGTKPCGALGTELFSSRASRGFSTAPADSVPVSPSPPGSPGAGAGHTLGSCPAPGAFLPLLCRAQPRYCRCSEMGSRDLEGETPKCSWGLLGARGCLGRNVLLASSRSSFPPHPPCPARGSLGSGVAGEGFLLRSRECPHAPGGQEGALALLGVT